MINKEFGYFCLVVFACAVFMFARSMNSDTAAAAPSLSTGTSAAPSEVVAETAQVPEVSPAAVKSPAAPAPKPQAVPVPPQAPPRVPPTLAAPSPSPTGPRPAGNPDDVPGTKRSGKIKASTNSKLPPAYGPLPAKVHVVVYSDFQCPVCRRAVEATHQIAEVVPGARVEFRQHALAMHKNAEIAAIASLAAHRQGKFWKMHDILFQNQSALDSLSLETYAQQIGLDMARYKKDIADPALKARVKAEGKVAESLGARGTPAFVVNGKLQVGWGSWQGFRGMVQRELSKVDEMLKSGTKLKDVFAVRAKEIMAPKDYKIYKAGVIDQVSKFYK